MSEHVPTETRECGCTVPETLYCAHDNREAMMLADAIRSHRDSKRHEEDDEYLYSVLAKVSDDMSGGSNE